MPMPAGLSDARLRAFVGAVFDAYYDWDVNSGSMQMSAQMDALLKLRPGELPREFDAFVQRIHPHDREATVQMTLDATKTGGVYDGEYRMQRGDGSFIVVRDRGVMIADEVDLSNHMIGAVRDVTQEREASQAERRAAELYHTLFAQAVNPAYHIAEDGRYLDANRAGLEFLAVSKSQLLREDVVTRWGREAPAALRAALSSSTSVATLDLEIVVAGAFKALAVTLLPSVVQGERTCFALGTDVTEHTRLRRALEASEQSLRVQAAALEDANTALRVILDQRNRDRTELEQTIVSNAETLIVPPLERLRNRLGAAPEAIYADAAIQNLRQLVHPFARALDAMAGAEARLTVRELEIANLIRAGKTSSAIAEAMFISPATVAFHRRNLRRKLGLQAHDPSLATHLARLP